jgi:hypothetical protein
MYIGLVKECCISNAVWELLNRCRFGDERFTWDGKEGKDDFFTPHQKAQQKKIVVVALQ